MNNVVVSVRGFTYYGTPLPVSKAAGYTGTFVPEDYIMTIVSSKLGIVRAVLQDKVSLAVGSDWQPFMDESKSGMMATLNKLSQAVMKRSLQASFSSRRMWVKTDPVSLTFTLQFNAERDASEEVVRPSSMLQAMTLPMADSIGLMIPPGPSPYQHKGIEFNKNLSDVISIYIGRFIGFRNVIVKSAVVDYGTARQEDGMPAASTVSLTFESYEILTKQKLSEVYKRPTLQELSDLDLDYRRSVAGMD